MGIYAVLAHYDPRGVVAPHVRRNIESLAETAEKLVVVSTVSLEPEDEQWLRDHATLIRRENYGYDFFSYRAGLLADGSLEQLSAYDGVLVCNDSFVGPVDGFASIMADMAAKPYDVWGFTTSNIYRKHIQSFFVTFAPWVVRSQAFERFWLHMTPLSDRGQVIKNYELGLTKILEEAGFAVGSYFVENAEDRRLSGLRWKWHMLLKRQDASMNARWQLWRQPVRADWNPSVAMADRILDHGRLPIAKIDTLRYDPYGLDTDRLLARCEAEYPAAFAGVRAYLRETEPFYPPRPADFLPEPKAAIRPLHRIVRYAGRG